MITIVATFTRPSLDVPFFVMPNELKDEFMTKFRYTGKSTSTSSTSNGLSSQVETVFRTRLDFTEYLEDPLSETMKNARIAYCDANGIILDTVIKFTPSHDDPGADAPTPALKDEVK